MIFGIVYGFQETCPFYLSLIYVPRIVVVLGYYPFNVCEVCGDIFFFFFFTFLILVSYVFVFLARGFMKLLI